ncbi:response regulator transcription factor [Pseudoalteromonas sp. SYSU M81241]
MANALHVSEATVKTHLASIYNKLDVPGRREAVLVAVERGLLQ